MPQTAVQTETAPLLIWSDATADLGIGTADETLDLIADGIMEADGLTLRSADPANDRTARIVFKRDFRREMAGWDWRLSITGNGHWCEGSNGMGGAGFGGTFRSAAEAITYGIDWIETGRDASSIIHAARAA